MSFGSQIDDFKKKIQEEAERKYRAAILQVMIGVIMDTPVLEGRLRGDWEAFINVYGGSESGQVDPAGSLAINKATALIRRVTLNDDVYFVNRLPYAYDIEYNGHSKKAPEGMLRKNMAQWRMLVEDDR